MASKTVKRIDELVDALRVHDKKVASDFNRLPKEPKDAMNELVKTGKPSVRHLLELLNNPSRFSCFYAAKVLGEIGDPAAFQPLLNLLFNEEFVETVNQEDEILVALLKIGLPALEPTLALLREKIKQEDEEGIYYADKILGGIKDEKSFNALVDLLPREEAIEALLEYGDKRAVAPVLLPHLKNLLENQATNVNVARDIQKLVSIQEYRDVLAPYVSKVIECFADKCARARTA